MSKDILTTVFTSLRKNFLKQAQRILASEEDAEDVVQDAFCKLWRSDYTLKTTNEAEALARTTIRNLSLDELRKQEVRPQFSLDTERDRVLQRSALEEIEIRERFEQVETIIEAALSPSERRVMHLKEYEEKRDTHCFTFWKESSSCCVYKWKQKGYCNDPGITEGN